MAKKKNPSLRDFLRTCPQYLLPHHFLSRLIYFATRLQWRPWKNVMISSFIRLYGIDMESAAESDYRNYPSFNHFFTRRLKNAARPVASEAGTIASPVDGTISQIGSINDGDIIQAKGRYFNLEELLAGDRAITEPFRNGSFATLYLSPRDYHRIHMPMDGLLTQMIYVPGRLFAVNPPATRCIGGLFSRNERIINLFETEAGSMALINIGALFVGSMETVWAGQVTPAGVRQITRHDYSSGDKTVHLRKGREMGRFNMGSTVVLLFEPGRIEWSAAAQPEATVQMGQKLGRLLP